MTLYDPDDTRHDAITPQERALIDSHIAQHGVTPCPPCTYSDSFSLTLREQVAIEATAAKPRKTSNGMVRNRRQTARTYFFGGALLTIAEISGSTGEPEKTVRSHISRHGTADGLGERRRLMK